MKLSKLMVGGQEHFKARINTIGSFSVTSESKKLAPAENLSISRRVLKRTREGFRGNSNAITWF